MSFLGFHLSGIVWTYPPNSIDAITTSNTSSSSNSNNTGSNSFNANGGNNIAQNANNLVGHPHQQQLPHQQLRTSTERDGINNNNSNYPIEENKKFKVSVNFDR